MTCASRATEPPSSSMYVCYSLVRLELVVLQTLGCASNTISSMARVSRGTRNPSNVAYIITCFSSPKSLGLIVFCTAGYASNTSFVKVILKKNHAICFIADPVLFSAAGLLSPLAGFTGCTDSSRSHYCCEWVAGVEPRYV